MQPIMSRHRRTVKEPTVHNVLMAQKELKVRQKQDLSRLIKDLYQRPDTGPEYQTSHVKKRTPSQYGSDLSEVSWEEKRRDRLYSQTCGYFSANNVPYKTVGSVVVDTGDLLIKIMENSLPKEFLNEYRGTGPSDTNHVTKYQEKKEKEEKQSQANAVISKADEHRRLAHCCTSGYTDIKRILKETEERAAVCRAGQCYNTHLVKCQQAKEDEQKLRNLCAHEADIMVVRQLSSDILLADVSRSDDSDDASSPPPPANERKKNLAVCVGEKFLKLNMMLALRKRANAAAENNRAHRRQWRLWVKLDDINLIMCYLYNMRSRHIKSRTPLTRKVLTGLQKNPFQGKAAIAHPGDQSRFSHRTTTSVNASHDALTSRSDVHGPEQRATSRKSVMESHLSTPRSHVSGDGTLQSQRHDDFRGKDAPRQGADPNGLGIGQPVGSKITPGTNAAAPLGGIPGKTFLRRKTRASVGPLLQEANQQMALDTWEDLINNGVNIGKKKLPKITRKMPPWQRQLSNTDSAIILKVPSTNRSEAEKHDDVMTRNEALVARLQTSFLHAKERLQTNAEHKIEKIERERSVRSRYKLEAFDVLNPLIEEQKRRLCEADAEADKDPQLIQEEKAEWYESLVDEVKTAELTKDRTIGDVMNKLHKYVRNKPSNVPQIKEKFCLLCTSMPVYDICNITMQQALLFVIENVLGCNRDVMKTCLDYRSLYLE